jgi:hypothetical protein
MRTLRSLRLINTIATVIVPQRNLMNKTIFPLLAAVTLVTANNSQAGLGWAYDQCVSRYGSITSPNTRLPDGSISCHFSASGYEITAFFDTNVVARIGYEKAFGCFDTAGVNDFLRANGPGAVWEGPQKDDADGTYRWLGKVDGEYGFFASLGDNGRQLVIWTKADNDFGAAKRAHEANGL